MTHLIQALGRSSSPHFTEEESKAQRDLVVRQLWEPTLRLNHQGPHPANPARVCKRRKEKSPAREDCWQLPGGVMAHN